MALAEDGRAPGDAFFAESTLNARFSRAILEFDPDVVHAGPLTDIAPFVGSVWSGPLIAMSWGFDLMDEIDRDHSMREKATAVLARADRIVVDNNGPRARAIALGADESRIVQFAWGVDLEMFNPGPSTFRAARGIPEQVPLVLCTRTHGEIYRVADVIDAFIIAASKNTAVHLALAGAGPLTAQLRARVDAKSLTSRVHFVGNLDALSLRDAHRTADLYVSASSVDGTSISLLEAMACGTPVCVSRIPGNAEWVDDTTGTTFTLGALDELASVFSLLGTGDARFDALLCAGATAALDRVRERADWRRTARQLPELAGEAVAETARREASRLDKQ